MRRFSHLTVIAVATLGLLLSACAPGNPMINEAERHLEDRDFEAALASLDEALEEEPENAEVYRMRGQVFQEWAEYSDDPSEVRNHARNMMEAYERALELDPGLEDAIETQRFFAYQSLLQQGADKFNEAADTQDEQLFNQAAGYFGAAGSIEPDSAIVFQNEAFALINAGREMDAIEPLERTVELELDEPDVYAILGNLYAIDGQGDRAIEVLEEARDRYPDHQEIQDQLVNVYLQEGRTEEAIAYYAEAVEREPDNATYRYNYGSLLLEADRFDEALEHLREATQLDSQNANAFYNLGAAHVNIAVNYNEQAIELDDELAETQDPDEQQQVQQELEQKLQERNEAFERAIEPLERARQLAQATGDLEEETVCTTLLTAYIQTDRIDRAQAISDCAGVAEEDIEAQQQPEEPPQN